MCQGSFDVLLPIGGLVRANLARPKTASYLLSSGSITATRVVGMASKRRATLDEARIARDLGAPDRSEEDALRWGLELAFGLQGDSWLSDDEDPEELLQTNLTGVIPVVLAGAPPIGDRRANTQEGMQWLLQKLQRRKELPATAKILQITTSIYWIANHIAIRTVVPDSISLTTIGYLEDLAPPPRQRFFSQHYLQEIKATLEALPALARWADRTGAPFVN